MALEQQNEYSLKGKKVSWTINFESLWTVGRSLTGSNDTEMASSQETPPALCCTFMVQSPLPDTQSASGTLLTWVVLWISIGCPLHRYLFFTVAAFASPHCWTWIQCTIYFMNINQGSGLHAREFSHNNGWQMDTSRQKNTRKQLCTGAQSDGQWSQPNSCLAGSRRRATCMLLYLQGQGLPSQKKLSLPPALQSQLHLRENPSRLFQFMPLWQTASAKFWSSNALI